MKAPCAFAQELLADVVRMPDDATERVTSALSHHAPASHSVRVPLQSGEASVSFLLAASVAEGALIFGLFLAGIGLGTAVSMVLFGLFVVVVALLLLWLFLKEARRHRASDLILQDNGLQVPYGRLHGWSASWADIAACQVRQSPNASAPEEEGGHVPLELVVTLATTKDSIVIAESLDWECDLTLEAVRAEIEARRTPCAQPDVVATLLPQCSSCGGLARVSSAIQVTCEYCGASVQIPCEAREAYQATQDSSLARNELRTQVPKVVTHIHSAQLVNERLGLIAAVVLSWPIAAAFFIGGCQLPLAWLPWLVVAVCAGLLGKAMASRRLTSGVQLFGLAAQPQGDAWKCRLCGADLATPEAGDALVSCGFCAADNLLGIHWRSSRGKLVATDVDLALMVQRHRAVTRRQLVTVIGAIAVILATVPMLDVRPQPTADGIGAFD